MFPIILDTSRTSMILVGNGEATLRRLRQLREIEAEWITLYAENPSEELAAAAIRLVRRWPEVEDFLPSSLVLIADLPYAEAARFAEQARGRGALVNAEDKKELCDFHIPAILRRDDLLLTVSTGGEAPGLAQYIRDWLGTKFGEEWRARLHQLAAKRRQWRVQGLEMKEVGARCREFIHAQGWLAREEEPLG